jgi:hypothetical protein
METLAYLLLSQELESQDDEARSGFDGLPLQLSALKLSSLAAMNLLSLLLGVSGSTWLLAAEAIAQPYVTDGLYPSSIYAFAGDQAVQYSSTAATYLLPETSIYAGGNYAYIQPNGDAAYVPCSVGGYYPPAYSTEYPTERYVSVRPASNLRQGDSGEAVRSLQDLLRNAGYFSNASTGYFGSATEAAVIAFQQDYGLIIDGVAGSQTIVALQGVY